LTRSRRRRRRHFYGECRGSLGPLVLVAQLRCHCKSDQSEPISMLPIVSSAYRWPDIQLPCRQPQSVLRSSTVLRTTNLSTTNEMELIRRCSAKDRMSTGRRWSASRTDLNSYQPQFRIQDKKPHHWARLLGNWGRMWMNQFVALSFSRHCSAGKWKFLSASITAAANVCDATFRFFNEISKSETAINKSYVSQT